MQTKKKKASSRKSDGDFIWLVYKLNPQSARKYTLTVPGLEGQYSLLEAQEKPCKCVKFIISPKMSKPGYFDYVNKREIVVIECEKNKQAREERKVWVPLVKVWMEK